MGDFDCSLSLILGDLADALQVKRIHEYKRQLLNVLGIIYRYDNIKQMSPEERKQVGSNPLDRTSDLINAQG